VLVYADDMEAEIVALLVMGLLIIWDNVRDFYGTICGDVH